MTNKKITESSIEQYSIELLEKQGFDYIYGPDIAPDSATPARQNFDDFLLLDKLKSAIARINPAIHADALEDAIKQIERLNSPELIVNNETFHRMLTEGININRHKDGQIRGDIVLLIDFENPENNNFLIVNQFTVITDRDAMHGVSIGNQSNW